MGQTPTTPSLRSSVSSSYFSAHQTNSQQMGQSYAGVQPSPPIFSSPSTSRQPRQDLSRSFVADSFRSSPAALPHSSPVLPPHPATRSIRKPSSPRPSSITGVNSLSQRTDSDVQSGSNGLSHGGNFDELDEIIMAIDMKDNGSVGCAYYVAVDGALFVQEDSPMAGMDFVETLLLRVEPTIVLISLRSPDSLVEFLESGAQDFDGNHSGKKDLLLLVGKWLTSSRRVSRCIYIADSWLF